MSDIKATRKIPRPLAPRPRPQKRDTSEDVAYAVGRLIVKGMHPPGALLPTEHELCASLGVSRPALREGFRLLGARGMIIGRRKIGTSVRPRSDWNMLDAAVLSWHLEQEPDEAYISHLFEARMVVEPAAAALAASRAGADGIETIARAFQRMSEAQVAAHIGMPDGSGPSVAEEDDEVAETVAADLQFHVAVLAAAGNLFLASFGALIGSSLLAAFRLNWRAHSSAPALSLAQHEAVLNAIRAGDADRAGAAMRALLDSASRDARHALARLVA